VRRLVLVVGLVLFLALNRSGSVPLDVAPNSWTRIAQDQQGARRHSSFRYVPDGKYFLHWGFMSYVTEQYGGPEKPWNGNNEYDVVVFDPDVGKWQSQYPHEKENEWRNHPPPMYHCTSYKGITTGSYRPQLKNRDGVQRPDLNIIFDQVAYDTTRSRMIYFTGGRTFAYDVKGRKWSDAAPGADGPPPVSGATLAYDPIHDQVVLAGGGHVAERGPGGKIVGYTGTWLFDCKTSRWRPLGTGSQPPPRMSTRLVYDTKNKVMVIFGGDGHSHYLADTWIYDIGSRRWRQSKAAGGPPPRAGHFTVFAPGTGWVIIGGGYNRQNLTDMWAYDAGGDKWMKLKGEVPVGWYVTADIMPENSLIVLTTSTKREGDTTRCNEIYPVRTTYAFKVRKEGLVEESVRPQAQRNMLKRSNEEATAGAMPDAQRRQAQMERIRRMPANRWVEFTNPGRVAPLRTWGSCSFDTHKGRLIYWGGDHCGYGGSEYDFYDVAENTWISSPIVTEYPERAWDKGINPAGVTFSGAPWMRHGRKIYAYDPVSRLVINMKTVLLTAGYEPKPLQNIELKSPFFGTGENYSRSYYKKWVTWTYDPANEKWEIICSGMPGLDLTVTTPHGVMAVDHHWDDVDSTDNSVYVLDVAGRQWKKLTKPGPRPRNLYEMTELVYDSRRDQLILHGGGPQRDELWRFRLSKGPGIWEKLEPELGSGVGGKAPACRREAMYLPGDDVMLTASGSGENRGLYAYHVGENRWYKTNVPAPPGKGPNEIVGQNRAWTYDTKHNLVLMVLGEGTGNDGKAQVFALRYDHREATSGK
jgi:hypothetical protein